VALNNEVPGLPGISYERSSMKSVYVVVLLLIVSCSTKRAVDKPVSKIKKYLIANIESLHRQTIALQHAVDEQRSNDAHLHFKESRLSYKKVESIVEYYFPGVAKALNGPALKKIEEEDDKLIEPTGFQVVEELIFQGPDSTDFQVLQRECKTLSSAIIRLHDLVQNNEMRDENVFEALRLQINRIISLGISGFDSPLMGDSMNEAVASLQGIDDILKLYDLSGKERLAIGVPLKSEFDKAKQYLSTHSDFNTFDRAVFITRYLNPIADRIYEYQNALSIANNNWPSAIRMDKKNIFEPGTFDPKFFAPAYNQESNVEIASLGKVLFFDPILSGNNSRSCASCHKPGHGFADPTVKSVGFDFKGQLKRNTPTLINSGYQQNQFWDGRVAYIEDQVFDVISSPIEMHGSISNISSVLSMSGEYTSLFKSAFPESGANAVNERNIQKALAGYLRSLSGLNSRFDQYMRGNYSALSKDEISGLNLFMGKAKCGTCHFMPLFNGSTPPMYKETEAEVIGVPAVLATSGAIIDQDPGKFKSFRHYLLRNMFKTPTVRNAAITSPYMHNGVYQTLEEVVDFYNKGGGAGIGITLDNQTLPTDELHLAEEEKQNIIAFIHALTDTVGLTKIPIRLPRLNDSSLNDRKVGGIY
jgi:cytochrome c peroxidase